MMLFIVLTAAIVLTIICGLNILYTIVFVLIQDLQRAKGYMDGSVYSGITAGILWGIYLYYI